MTFDIVTTMVIKKLEENKIEMMKTAICRDFYLSCKKKTDLKIGMELERLPIYKNSYQAVDYFGANGMYRFLRQLAYNDEWRYITDLNFINGLKKSDTTITLEPGGQCEYSLSPCDNLFQLKNQVESLDNKVLPILDFLGISMLEYPITPLTDGRNIEIIPKRRYQTMAKYMNGERCFSMMRETAGIQVSLDYTDEIDAMQKYKIAMMISPFITAIFANSPIRCGKITGYKSTRALAWLNTDEKRCGLVSEKIFDHKQNFSFSDYVNKVFSVPLLFIQRDNKIIEIGGKIDFEQFALNGWQEHSATREDYDLHATLFFPEVRLKNIIEVRNQDCQKGALKYSIPALYKGIFYNSDSIQNIFELLKIFSYKDFQELRYNVPKSALDTKIGKKRVLDYAKNILNIAFQGLVKLQNDEEKFLEPIMELTYDGLCPADIILKEWEKSKHNMSDFIEYVRLK